MQVISQKALARLHLDKNRWLQGQLFTEVSLEPCQTSVVEHFAKIINS